MQKLLIVLIFLSPLNSYAFNMLDSKNFYITIWERPNPFIRKVSRNYGQEYGLFASMFWHVGEEEIAGSPNYSNSKRIYFTWEF